MKKAKSADLTWREIVWNVARHFHRIPKPAELYDRIRKQHPRRCRFFEKRGSKRVPCHQAWQSSVRAALASLVRDGYVLDEHQRAEMARSPKPWNIRNQMRRDVWCCVSCPLRAVKVVLPVGEDELRTYSLGRCKKHQASHAEACRQRSLKLAKYKNLNSAQLARIAMGHSSGGVPGVRK